MKMIVLRMVTVTVFVITSVLLAGSDEDCRAERGSCLASCDGTWCVLEPFPCGTHPHGPCFLRCEPQIDACYDSCTNQFFICLAINEFQPPPIRDGVCDETLPYDPDCACPLCP